MLSGAGPVASGTPAIGERLTCSADPANFTPIAGTLRYQWGDVAGGRFTAVTEPSTSPVLVVVEELAEARLACRVLAFGESSPVGGYAIATSNVLAAVPGLPTVPPVELPPTFVEVPIFIQEFITVPGAPLGADDAAAPKIVLAERKCTMRRCSVRAAAVDVGIAGVRGVLAVVTARGVTRVVKAKANADGIYVASFAVRAATRHRVQLFAVDAAGNVSKARTLTFTTAKAKAKAKPKKRTKR